MKKGLGGGGGEPGLWRGWWSGEIEGHRCMEQQPRGGGGELVRGEELCLKCTY